MHLPLRRFTGLSFDQEVPHHSYIGGETTAGVETASLKEAADRLIMPIETRIALELDDIQSGALNPRTAP
jgi:hypothetical protein